MKALVTVGDKKYEVPEKLTVDQFAAIQQFGYDNSKAQKLICATVLGAPLNTFTSVDDEELTTLLAICLVPLGSLDSAEKTIHCLDMETLTFGQFVDLDVVSHRGLKHNLPQLIAILHEVEVDEILDQPIDLYWPSVQEWLTFRSKLYSSYAGFFGIEENDAQASGGEQESIDASRVWYTALMVLADEDFLKIHQVTERPVIEAMNFLAYVKDKRYREQQEQKRRNAQLKHR